MANLHTLMNDLLLTELVNEINGCIANDCGPLQKCLQRRGFTLAKTSKKSNHITVFWGDPKKTPKLAGFNPLKPAERKFLMDFSASLAKNLRKLL